MQRRSEQGFTLVELAIALMIIGLLLGAVLKGNELFENARVTKTATYIKAYETAATSFRTSYGALPGDITDPGARLPNCTTAPCNTGGDGDGYLILVGSSYTGGWTYGTETSNFWLHLAKTNFIAGIDPNYTGTPRQYGVDAPESPLGGGFRVQSFTTTLSASAMQNQTLLEIIKDFNTASTSNLIVTPAQAAQIDRKLDDGKANAGDVFAYGPTSGTCISASDPTAYLETKKIPYCVLYAVLNLSLR